MTVLTQDLRYELHTLPLEPRETESVQRAERQETGEFQGVEGRGLPCLTLDLGEVADAHGAAEPCVEVPAHLQVGVVGVGPGHTTAACCILGSL